MPDIFGKTGYAGYDHYRDIMKNDGDVERYVRNITDGRELLDGKSHNFDALGSQREIQGGEPYGFLLDNLVAVQARVEEQYIKRARIERYMPITDVPEDAGSHAVTTLDTSGSAKWIDASGADAPTVQTGATTVAVPMNLAGSVALMTDEDVRKASRGGVPLQTANVDRAMVYCTELMADAALKGDGVNNGLVNQATRTGNTNLDRVKTEDFAQSFTTGQEDTTAGFIAKLIGELVTDSRGVLGDSITGDVVVGLPSQEYNFVVSNTISNRGSDLSIAQHVMAHNGWVDEASGNSVRFERITELEDVGTGGTPRMVVFLSNPEVIEYPVAIRPRVSKVVQTLYGFNISVVAKAAQYPLVKRPVGIRYGGSIRA